MQCDFGRVKRLLLTLVFLTGSATAMALPDLPFCPLGGPPGWWDRIIDDDPPPRYLPPLYYTPPPLPPYWHAAPMLYRAPDLRAYPQPPHSH